MATVVMAGKKLSAPDSVGRALNFTASTGAAVANRLLAPHGLGLAQWAVLVSIWRNGALSVKEIAELTGNAPPAASRIVERMVQGGLLVRRTDPADRRAVVVGLSARGEALRPLHDIYEEVNRILLAELSVEEARTLFDLLDRVQMSGRRWLGGETGDGPAE
jgi:DNA-binding MarR family transcriptional regulator